MTIRKETTHRVHILILLLIMLGGALLRLSGLANQSLDNDELSSWTRSNYATFAEVIAYGARYDGHPPGYHFLLYWVEKYLGDSETILRLPSAIAGILTIPAFFLLGRRLYSPREGLISAALVATLWFPLYYSQTARAYALVLLFSVVSAYFWLDIVFKTHSRFSKFASASLGYVITAVILCYLHYFGAWLVALQALGAAVVVLAARKQTRIVVSFVGIYMLVVIAYLPWVPFMLEQFSYADRLFPKLRDTLMGSQTLTEHSVETVNGAENSDGNESGATASQTNPITRYSYRPHHQFFLDYYLFLYNKSRLVGVAALALYALPVIQILTRRWGAIAPTRKPRLRVPDLVLISWLLLPMVTTYLISLVSQPLLSERNFIVSLPAAYLLLARAITLLPITRKGQTLVTIAFIGLSLYQLFFRIEYYSKPHKAQFREAVAYVAEHEVQYPNALLIGYAHSPSFFEYYLERMNASQHVELIAGAEEDIATVDEMLSVKRPTYLWYITAHREPEAEFLDFLRHRLVEVEHEELEEANVWLFKSQ